MFDPQATLPRPTPYQASRSRAPATGPALGTTTEDLAPGSAPPAPTPASSTLQVVAAVLEAPDWHDAIQALSAILRQQLQVERIALAMRHGARLREALVVETRQVELAQQTRALLAAAQHEALDQRCLIVDPPLGQNIVGPIGEAHRRLRAALGGCSVSLPLTEAVPRELEVEQGGDCAVGVLSVWRSAPSRGFDERELDRLRDIAAFVGPILALRYRAEHRPAARIARRWRRQVPGWARQPRTAVALVGLPVALMLCWPLPDHVWANARIESETQRTLVAPSSGYLAHAHVRAGDDVRAGQVLVELATDDLRLEHERLTHALQRAESSQAEANARGERAQFVLESARALEARAQLDLVDSRIQRARIVAPFDGVVVRGDLSRQVGAPLTEGTELLTVAPPGRWRVVAEVDERQVSRLRTGHGGQLQLSALPWDSLPIRVERIAPIATAANGSNVFEVHAGVDAPEVALRPGLAGQARFRVGERALAQEIGEKALLPVRRLWWWILG